MAAKRHTHKYHRRSINGNKVWACAFGDCTHYQPKHLEDQIDGRFSVCWNCGEVFTLDSRNMQSDKPECNECNPSPLLEYVKELIPPIDPFTVKTKSIENESISEPKTIEEVIADLSKGK